MGRGGFEKCLQNLCSGRSSWLLLEQRSGGLGGAGIGFPQKQQAPRSLFLRAVLATTSWWEAAEMGWLQTQVWALLSEPCTWDKTASGNLLLEV